MKVINLLAFFFTVLVSVTIQTLLKKSLLKSQLTNKYSEYSESRAKSYSKFLMGASCAKKPLKKTCALCVKPTDGNEFVHFYLSKRNKLPFKLLIHYNDALQKIFLFFSGPIFNKSNIQYFDKHFLSGNHLKDFKQYQGDKVNSEIYNVYFKKIKQKIYKNLQKLIKSNRDEFGLVFVGNSVAGSLATFAAFDVKSNFEKEKNFKSFEVYAFNAFNFADDGFNQKLKNSRIKFFRIFKENDFIISPNCAYDRANSKWKCSKVQDAALLQGDAKKADSLGNSTNNNHKNTTETSSNNNATSNGNNSSLDANYTAKAANRSFRFDEEFIYFLEENNAFELIDESETKDYFNTESDNNRENINEENTTYESSKGEENLKQFDNDDTVNGHNNTALANANLTSSLKNTSNSNSNSTEVSKSIKTPVINSNNSAPAVVKNKNTTQKLINQHGNPELIKRDNKMKKNITIRINMNSTNSNNVSKGNITHRVMNNTNLKREKGLLLDKTLDLPNNASNNYNMSNNASNNNNKTNNASNNNNMPNNASNNNNMPNNASNNNSKTHNSSNNNNMPDNASNNNNMPDNASNNNNMPDNTSNNNNKTHNASNSNNMPDNASNNNNMPDNTSNNNNNSTYNINTSKQSVQNNSTSVKSNLTKEQENNSNLNSTALNLTGNSNNTLKINNTAADSNNTNTNKNNFNNTNNDSTHNNNSSNLINNNSTDSNNKTNTNNTNSASNNTNNKSNKSSKHKNKHKHKHNHKKNHKQGNNSHSHKKENSHEHNKHNHKKIEEFKKTENSSAETNNNNSIINLISRSNCYANTIKTDPGMVLLRVDPGTYGEIIVYNREMNKFESCTPEESKDNDCKKCLINLVLDRSINNYSHLDLFGEKLDSCKHK